MMVSKEPAISKFELDGRVEGGLLSVTISELLCLLGFNLLFFSPTIQQATGFAYIDEGATLLLFAAAIASHARRKSKGAVLEDEERRCVLLLTAWVVIGLLGNAIFPVQQSPLPIAIDIFACIKFPVALLSAFLVFKGMGRGLVAVQIEVKMLIVVMLFFGIANLIDDYGMGADPRYGLRASFFFIYPHPTSLVCACVGIVMILCTDLKRNKVWIFLALVVICFSLRSKGIAFAALAVILMFTVGKSGRLTAPIVAVLIVAVIAIGWDQFSYYFTSSGFARTELVRTSVQIANSHFPIGAGFATFGSSVTASPSYYSQLYYDYDLSMVQGLTPADPSFLSDTFWPTVIGQTGWVGLVVYIAAIAAACHALYRRSCHISPGAMLSVLFCFAYLLISSTAESAFFHPMAVYLAFCLGLAFACRETVGSVLPSARQERMSSV